MRSIGTLGDQFFINRRSYARPTGHPGGERNCAFLHFLYPPDVPTEHWNRGKS